MAVTTTDLTNPSVSLSDLSVNSTAPAPRVEDTPGFLSGVAAGVMNETEIGAVVDGITRSNQSERLPTFNPYSYIEGLEDPERRQLGLQLGAAGAFNDRRSYSPEDVEGMIDQYVRQDERAMVAGSSTSAAAGYIAGSFLSLSTLVPIGGAAYRAGRAAGVASRLRSGAAAGALEGAASEAFVQGALSTSQVGVSEVERFLNVGISTALGGGIGGFGALFAKRGLRDKVADSLDITVPDDPSEVNRSAGAAANPSPEFTADNRAPLGATYNNVQERLPWLGATPVAATYRAAAAGLDYGADVMRRLGIVGPAEGHRKGIAEAMNAEDLAEVEYTTKAQLAEVQFNRAWVEYRSANPNVSADEFNIHAAMVHQFPDHTSGDAALDAAVRQAIGGQAGSQSFFGRLYRDMNDYGLFPTNKMKEAEDAIAQVDAKLGKLEADMATTPTGRKRKQDTKLVEKMRERKTKLEARRARILKEEQDRGNYFTQSWDKLRLAEMRDKVEERLTRMFVDRAAVSEEMVERAYREAQVGPSAPGTLQGSDDELLDVLLAFEEGGVDSLPPEVARTLELNQATYARQEAKQVVDQLITGGKPQGDYFDNAFVESSRTRGRRIQLDEATTEDFLRLGVLDGDVARVVRKNNADVGGRLALRRTLGVRGEDDLEELFRQGEAEVERLIDAGKLSREEGLRLSRELYGTGDGTRAASMMRVQVDRLLNRRGYDDDADELSSWLGAQAMKFNYVRLLGGMTVSAISDLATQIHTAGFKRTPTIARSYMRNIVRGTRKIAAEIPDRDLRQVAIGVENVLAGQGRMAKLYSASKNPELTAGIGLGKTKRVTGAIERGLDGMASVMGDVTLMNQWNRAGKRVATDVFMMKVHDYGSGVARMSDKEVEAFARYGLTKQDLEWIARQPAADVDGVRYPDTTQFSGANAEEMRIKFLVAIKRAGEEAIVSVRKGDKPVWMDKGVGRLIGQFTSFGYAWNNRVGRRALKHGLPRMEMEQLSFLGMSIALGSMSFIIKATYKGQDLPDPSEPEGMTKYLSAGIDRGGLLGQFTAPVNGALGVASAYGMFGDLYSVSRFAGRDAGSALVGPTFGLASEALNLAYSAPDMEPEKILQKTLRLMPYNNVFYVDALTKNYLFDN